MFPVPIWASVTRMTNTESASVPENTSYPWTSKTPALSQYRKNWKKDRKRRKEMEPSEDILTRSWQVVSSQQWNELTKQWVITTLKAPADIITKDVIDKLGFEAETEY